MRRALLLLLLALAAWSQAVPSLRAQAPAGDPAVVLTVTSAADPGDGRCDATCTLRDALLAAVSLPLPARIEFAIGRGPVTIRLQTALPFVETAGTVVDGTTQPGYAGRPLIMLDGRDAPLASGLVSLAARVEFRGLAVGNFVRYGLAALAEEADDNRFLGNWVGLALDGQTAAPNRLGGIAVLAGADDAQIGGVCANCGNRLAGNANEGRTGHGVLVGGPGTTGVRIRGNVIGLALDGSALPNDDGILVVDGAHATIGGRAAGEGNVVSGNIVAGIELRDTFLLMRIEGNWVGLDESGARAVANDVGIFINDGAGPVRIGAGIAEAANTVAGNRVGIAIEQQARDVHVLGNVIGLSPDGTRSLGNGEDGISIVAGAREVRIGGSRAGEGNLIGGNGNGIVIASAATQDVTLEGNTIGLLSDGRSAAPNQTGILVSAAAEVTIGGLDPGSGNVIVASRGSGIVLEEINRASIVRNRIGLLADDTPLGNGVGVTLQDGASNTQVQFNRIGGNVGAGVEVLGQRSRWNRLTRNWFLANGGLGIDLNGDGPTANDEGDTDAGPNALLNTPVFTGVNHDGAWAAAWGTAPPESRVEIYAVMAADGGGFGPGADLLAQGVANAVGGWLLRFQVESGARLTALSIATSGNTSEFSATFVLPPPVALAGGFTPVGWFGPPTPVTAAIASLAGRVIALFRFDAERQAWDVHRPGRPFLSSLDALQPGDALWVQLPAGPDVVWVQPAEEAAARGLALRAGLNFATWSGGETDVAEALAGIEDGVETVFRWNRESGRFELIWPALPGTGTGPAGLVQHDVLWLRLSRDLSWEQPRP